MKNKYGIEKDVYQEMINIFKGIEEIEEVILFGSRAKNTYKETSDIDLAIKVIEDSKKLLLIRKLDEIRCALKFDVLNIKYIKNEQLIYDIKNEGIKIYKKQAHIDKNTQINI